MKVWTVYEDDWSFSILNEPAEELDPMLIYAIIP